MFRFLFIISLLSLKLIRGDVTVPLWPLPTEYSFGSKSIYLSKDFNFILSTNQIKSDELTFIIDKYTKIVNSADSSENIHIDVSLLENCYINISDLSTNLSIESDESYDLSITTDNVCNINAQTIWGVNRALETFTQLLVKTVDTKFIVCNYIPVDISDSPRFKHRGLLIDTSRHYLPISTIKRVIDSLPDSKLNVLHWHIVDAQSFPLILPNYPRIINSAYSPSLTYLPSEISEVYLYAKRRGVRIVFEFDIPGHTGCLWHSVPDVMSQCVQKYSYNINDFALDPTNEVTYDFVYEVLQVLRQIDKDSESNIYIHVGGDEVVYGCWREDDRITSYMSTNNISSYDSLLASFVGRVDDMIVSLNATPIHWEEVFYTGASVPSGTIYQVWDSFQPNAENKPISQSTKMSMKSSDESILQTIVGANYQVIASPSDYWYLNFLSISWKTMYSYNPTDGLTDQQADLVLGGEAAVWGEYVDETNIMSTIYPRLFAVSERLWSDSSVTSTDDALNRLLIQRCRLLQRGFEVAPVQPGYCNTNYV